MRANELQQDVIKATGLTAYNQYEIATVPNRERLDLLAQHFKVDPEIFYELAERSRAELDGLRKERRRARREIAAEERMKTGADLDDLRGDVDRMLDRLREDFRNALAELRDYATAIRLEFEEIKRTVAELRMDFDESRPAQPRPLPKQVELSYPVPAPGTTATGGAAEMVLPDRDGFI
jgi:transcriptional regulator with XRE-family HTH domain